MIITATIILLYFIRKIPYKLRHLKDTFAFVFQDFISKDNLSNIKLIRLRRTISLLKHNYELRVSRDYIETDVGSCHS